MTQKIFYGMGCTCDPHLTMKKSFPGRVAPSLFAGMILFQRERPGLIQQSLFDGGFERYFFGMDNWKPVWPVKFAGNSAKTDGVYWEEDSGKYFQYFNNRQYRTYDVPESVIGMAKSLDRSRPCYVNDELGMFNTHAADKTPGINPAYKDYQLKKYEFFLENKSDFKYLFYMHRDASQDQVSAFAAYMLKNGYDLGNFVFFNRGKLSYEVKGIVQVQLPDSPGLQANPTYGAQCLTMREYIKNLVAKCT